MEAKSTTPENCSYRWKIPGIMQKCHSADSAMSYNDCFSTQTSTSSNELRPRKRLSKLRVRSVDGGQVVSNIELNDLRVPDSSDNGRMPQLQRNHGHLFVSAHLNSPTWCDVCGDFIWGMYKECLICTNCHFTCHHKCCSSISVDCSASIFITEQQLETSFNDGHLEEECLLQRSPSKRRWIFDSVKTQPFLFEEDSICETDDTSGFQSDDLDDYYPSQQTLTREDCRRRIRCFNSNSHGLVMEPPEGKNDVFQGSIRVHMNLIRPINMCISLPTSPVFDLSNNGGLDGAPVNGSVDITSFYLPKGTSKVIHISSATTTPEVIQILLSKFHITDNPRKFALYAKTHTAGKTARLRRLYDDEMPLQICLSWADDGIQNLDCNQFILQENDTGNIQWDAFSLPELENFLRVLNREEEEYIGQVRMKYQLRKVQLLKRLSDKVPSSSSSSEHMTDGKRKPVFV